MNKPTRLNSFEALGVMLQSDGNKSPDSHATIDPLRSLVTLRIHLETKGRKGKGVTVIQGFHHTDHDLAAIARNLKTLCGAGGTVKDNTVEIQGDHRETVAARLEAMGFRLKVVR